MSFALVYMSAADKVKLDLLTLPVAIALNGGGILNLSGFTFSIPASGTAALRDVDNQFTVAQGIRAAAAGIASGLNVPFILGDILPTVTIGGVTSTQRPLVLTSNSGGALYASTVSNTAIDAVSSSGLAINGETTSGNAAIQGRSNPAAGNSVVEAIRFVSNPSVAVAAGVGVALSGRLKTSDGTQQTAGRLVVLYTSLADTSTLTRAGTIQLRASDFAGERTGLALRANGSAPELGFFGVTPVIRPTVTGSRAANPALASLLSALAALGLIIDNTII